MEEKKTKYLKGLSRRIIEETSVESPSSNFIDAVMTRVNALQESQATVYKPLISKTGWILISLGVLALVLYVLLFESKGTSTNWIQSINFGALPNINLNVIPNVSLSKTFTYAVLFFGLMICIQIPLLKNYFDKRFEV